MRSNEKDYPQCFYCGCTLVKGRVEMDHFPIPQECGGEWKVPSCGPCHDMKDRLNVMNLSMPVMVEFLGGFEQLNRGCRIVLAKALAALCRLQHAQEKR